MSMVYALRNLKKRAGNCFPLEMRKIRVYYNERKNEENTTGGENE